MMNATLQRSILTGALVLFIGNLAAAVGFAMGYGWMINPIFLFLPTVSAFLVAYLSPRNKIVAGMSMAIFGAIIAFLTRTALERLGTKIDSVGTPAETFLILLSYHLAYASVGAAGGYLFWRLKARGQSQSS